MKNEGPTGEEFGAELLKALDDARFVTANRQQIGAAFVLDNLEALAPDVRGELRQWADTIVSLPEQSGGTETKSPDLHDDDPAKCCAEGSRNLRWLARFEPDFSRARWGWVIPRAEEDREEPACTFCPWCGKRLPQ